MARISAQEKEQKKAMMDEHIYQLFIKEGWDSVTYDRLAKDLNLRKSSIQAYYEKSIMFATALQGRVFPVVIQKLDFSSKEAFIESWVRAFHDENCHIFRDIVKMLLQDIIKTGSSIHSKGAVLRIEQMLAQSIGEEEAKICIKRVFGETLYSQMSC
ncbi:TetR/AcrR family transcriptional regulator [Photobacterium leiognathi]|uniref:TetR/AcrR family transcriptional regulator n=1 Tax=Photobacterium leiognathi TaxID=553611 RepID=UPI001EDD237D|nr:TetR/AcrR family transcriptional regulator [Photobacterium leiognathi]MCG3885114.1 TetR/AcrR family transcriptional regulator [Photobacterium leiognathi]